MSSSSSSSGRFLIPDPTDEGRANPPHLGDELARICDALLVRGEGRREIEVDEREQLAENEAVEIAEREATVRSRKRQLHEFEDDGEASTSEREDERRHEMRTLEHEIESLGDGVRAPDLASSSVSQMDLSEPPGFEIVEPSAKATSSAMWEPTFSERAKLREEHRINFVRIYPGHIEHRHATIRAILEAAGPRPSLGLRTHVDLARKSLVLFTRAKEDDLLRTPTSRERCCRNDYTCELYRVHAKIGRECLIPQELQEHERSGILPPERRPCLGCMRHDVTYFWMYMRWRGEHLGNAFITSHYNLTNMAGEYLQDQCILSSSLGLPLPVVPFVPGSLSLRDTIKDGETVTYFDQVGMVKLDKDSDFP